jgi:hypothetical protein
MNTKCVFCGIEIIDGPGDKVREFPVCDKCMNLPYLSVKAILKGEKYEK